jgi:DNA-binding MarR family transcriptional regulator
MDVAFDDEDNDKTGDEKYRIPLGRPKTRLTHWLTRAERRVSGSFAGVLAEFDLIPSEWSALRALHRPGRLSPVDIGKRIGMSKGGASKLVDRLVKKGFVRKYFSALDRRMRAVELTAKGWKIARELDAFENFSEDYFFEYLEGYSRSRFLRVLVRTAHLRKSERPIRTYPRSATPPRSTVASRASNSSVDSSRNRPRER